MVLASQQAEQFQKINEVIDAMTEKLEVLQILVLTTKNPPAR